MAILYDWNKILDKADRKLANIIAILKMITFKRKPRNKLDFIYKLWGTSFKGDSFLLAPELLLDNAWKYSEKEVVEYVALASFRNFSVYKIFGDATLSLMLSPVGPDKITNNRLLTLKNSKIHFLYEEMYKEEKQKWLH